MTKLTKMMLLSITTLCVSVAVAVGGTFALFTGEVKVNNHLQAGNLQVGLYRVAYTENLLNDDGLLKEVVVQSEDDDRSNDLDLVKSGEKLFNIINAVPQSWCKAKLQVVNNGTVAFDYGVKILWSANDVSTDLDEELAKQIQLTITYGTNNVKSFALSDCDLTENSVVLGCLLKGESGEFTVMAEFLDDADADEKFTNNDVMNQSLEFDIQVFATQAV